MANDIRDREAANYCDYFRPQHGLSALSDPSAAAARARLNALFGEKKPAGKISLPTQPTTVQKASDEAERARKKLEEVFGLKK
ncbi:MAG: hypothetical protein OEW39_09485 [Deltaproteobacteria bacterium]|nr:hypothetical protein [Deltaproteobacteria bacterium]